ncbi:uncharacterized protein LOC119678509 [Teleopsis dalmanni]|uniref:uncharacterized protein LOC119678509 n=1 Tax=Teleopsis dalmanni TaxID=139649 RepID=UPI0018CF8586|nr:uncharacterized protein LOC119678509 [Teleopsis dalmanni]
MSSSNKWNNLSSSQRLEFLVNPANVTDCIFIVGKHPDEIRHFQLHKKVLSECSEVFSSMFFGGSLESKDNCEVFLDDAKPTAFQYFINYIYFQILYDTISLSDLFHLASLSNKYMVLPLCEHIKKLVEKKHGTFLTALEFSKVIENPFFENQKAIIEHIQFKWERNEYLQSCTIFDISAASFVLLVEKFFETRSIENKFAMIENYIEKNCISEKTCDDQTGGTKFLNGTDKIIADRLLLLVDLEKMTAQQFCSGPLKSSVINVHKKLDVLAKIGRRVIEEASKIKIENPPEVYVAPIPKRIHTIFRDPKYERN